MRAHHLALIGLITALPAWAGESGLDPGPFLKRVEQIRQLKPLKPLKHEAISADGVRRYVSGRFAEAYTRDEMLVEGKTYEKLGLLPGGTNYPQLLTDLLKTQIAGFYDPPTQKLFVASWIPLAAQAPTMVHEITHALQDQHFDLSTYIQPIKENTDAQLARNALAEGDAMLVTLKDAGIQLPDPPSELAGRMMAFSDGPAYLAETMSFPYLAGLDLVDAQYQRGGWKAVDAMYKRPPATTEQVLHPDKYRDDEQPRPVDEWGARFKRRDVLGEFGLQRFVAATVGDQEAEKAAAGWNGDRLWTLDASYALVSLSYWDRALDAREFQVAANKRLAALAGQKPNNDYRYKGKDGTFFRVERHGEAVLCLIGVKAADEHRIATQVWLHQTK